MKTQESLRLFQSGPATGLKCFILVVCSVVLMIADHRWTWVVTPIRTTFSTVLYPLRELAYLPKTIVSNVSDWSDAVSNMRKERSILENQRIELDRLHTQFDQVSSENAQLRQLLGIKKAVMAPSVAVEILYTSENSFGQTLVLSSGSRQGIQAGDPVIGEGGVVGQIQRVTPFTAEAQLITDERIAIPAMIVRNSLRVVVFGSGQDRRLDIRYLPNGADVKVGDTLVTSGIGGVYPPGLSIGEVIQVDNHNADGFLRAYVRPTAHPERYRHFLVLLQGKKQ